MSNDRIDLDRIERELRDTDHAVDVCTTWQNGSGERETEYLCSAREMLRLVRAVRASQAYCEWSSGGGEMSDARPYRAMCEALAPFRKETP